MAKGGRKRRSSRGRERVRKPDLGRWEPRTNLGRLVKSGEITNIDQIYEMGRPILEPEIVDSLIEELYSETLEIRTTQRVTDSGKRTKFRVVVVVGDRKGHVGLGVGKSEEIRPAINYAIKNAKKNVISIKMGCGSWECKCDQPHSVPMSTEGKEGSTVVKLKSAPKGLGLASNDIVKKVLSIAGVRDVWGSMSGGRNTYNMAVATIRALDNINKLKPHEEG